MATKGQDIVSVIKQQIEQFGSAVSLVDVGTVIEVGDGIARIHGLAGARASELLQFPGDVMGIALNLDADSVSAVILGDYASVKEGDEVNLRIEVEYEFMLTQKWVLAPEVEINWFSDDDDDVGVGSGLARLEAGVRLRYEITRQIAPYIGINYKQLLGDTKDLADEEGEETSDVSAVAGLRFWF